MSTKKKTQADLFEEFLSYVMKNSLVPTISNSGDLMCPLSTHNIKDSKTLYLCTGLSGMIWSWTHEKYNCVLCKKHLEGLKNFWFCPYCSDEHNYYICQSCETTVKNDDNKNKTHLD